MAEIKLYLDEDISHVIARVLRSRGYDVVSAHEVPGMEGRTDREQLDWAATQDRVLVTFNVRHFAELADLYYREDKSHAGILVSPQVGFSELLHLLLNVLIHVKPEHLKNTFQWLQSYR